MEALMCVTHTADHRETVRRTVTSFPGLVIISLFHIVANTYRTTYRKTKKNNQLILNHSEFYRHTNDSSSCWKSSKLAFTDLLSPFCTLETHSYRTLWNRIMRGKSLLRIRMEKSAYIYIKIYIKQQPKILRNENPLYTKHIFKVIINIWKYLQQIEYLKQSFKSPHK